MKITIKQVKKMTYEKSWFKQEDLDLIDVVYSELERIATLERPDSIKGYFPKMALSEPFVAPIQGKCDPKKILRRQDYATDDELIEDYLQFERGRHPLSDEDFENKKNIETKKTYEEIKEILDDLRPNEKEYQEIQIETCPLDNFTLMILDTRFLLLAEKNSTDQDSTADEKALRKLINVEHRSFESTDFMKNPKIRNQYIITYKNPKKTKTIINLMIDTYPKIEKSLFLSAVLEDPKKNRDSMCSFMQECLDSNEYDLDYGPFTLPKLPTGEDAKKIHDNINDKFIRFLIKRAQMITWSLKKCSDELFKDDPFK